MNVPASLLILTAHPDDESFFAAGTIARYTRQGASATIVCATRGQRGATGGLCSVGELPRVREAELHEAARILGAKAEFLDYEDQKLSTAPPERIRRQLVEVIRRTAPDIIMTFDSNGTNQHTDHIAISRFAADAIAAAADPRWYPELGPAHATSMVLWPSDIAVWKLSSVANLAASPGIDYIIDVSDFWQAKEAALRAHRTQVPGFSKLFFEKPDNIRSILSIEAFRLATGYSLHTRPLFDLFEAAAG